MMAQKTALVTGASEGGIGSSLVKAFQRKGYHVFATVRSLDKGAHLDSLPDVELIILDVTDPEAIAKVVETVNSKIGGKLDVLVNNSGGGHTMPLLDTLLADARQLFDLNVFSVLAMTQAFAPLLIASKGTLVNIASIAGVCVRPYAGARWRSGLRDILTQRKARTMLQKQPQPTCPRLCVLNWHRSASA